MQPGPGSALEMVEPEFLLELLMRLFADPARLAGASDVLDRGVGGKVREIVFSLSIGARLAHQPGFLARHMLRASRTDKLHYLADALGRPLAFHLTGGEAADCKAYDVLLVLPECTPDALLADKG